MSAGTEADPRVKPALALASRAAPGKRNRGQRQALAR